MNICNIRNSFEQKKTRNWDTLYVLVDVHGTIIPNSYHNTGKSYDVISKTCVEVLQWFTNRKDIKMIMWTSTPPDEIGHILDWMEKEYGIVFNYVNCNPECKNTEYADFSKKPYFNIIIDDKAGFDPNTDWKQIKNVLISLDEWNKV